MRIDIGQLEFIDSKLRGMAIQLESHFGVEFEVKSIYRIDDNGVHGALPVRGLDLGCHDRDFGEAVENYLNSLYVYDLNRPDRKVCMYHDAGSGFHLHLQVHPDTQLR